MKIAYLLFGDAPHLNNKGQPDEMVAEVKLAGKDIMPPWRVDDQKEFDEYIQSIAPIISKWESTQPFLVEIGPGTREEWTLQKQKTGEVILRPKPVLQPQK